MWRTARPAQRAVCTKRRARWFRPGRSPARRASPRHGAVGVASPWAARFGALRSTWTPRLRLDFSRATVHIGNPRGLGLGVAGPLAPGAVIGSENLEEHEITLDDHLQANGPLDLEAPLIDIVSPPAFSSVLQGSNLTVAVMATDNVGLSPVSLLGERLQGFRGGIRCKSRHRCVGFRCIQQYEPGHRADLRSRAVRPHLTPGRGAAAWSARAEPWQRRPTQPCGIATQTPEYRPCPDRLDR